MRSWSKTPKRREGGQIMKIRNLLLLGASISLLSGCSGQKAFIALGGADVPVGQYSDKILAYYGIDKEALEKKGIATFESDVKGVTSKVKEATVQCGIIYKTDAFSAELEYVDTANKDMCGRCVYPAAIIKNDNGHADIAASFLSYLTTEDAMSEFTKVGFKQEAPTGVELPQTAETVELKVFAAASMTESLNAVKAKYAAVHPNVTLSISYGSSGALKTQIKEGPNNCDVFISAGQKQVNAIDGSKEGHEADLVVSRFDILENTVVLAVPKDNPGDVKSFADLAEKLKAKLA